MSQETVDKLAAAVNESTEAVNQLAVGMLFHETVMGIRALSGMSAAEAGAKLRDMLLELSSPPTQEPPE